MAPVQFAALVLACASSLCVAKRASGSGNDQAHLQTLPENHQQLVHTQASMAELSDNSTHLNADWDLYCKVGSAGLNAICIAEGADCAAGTWQFQGKTDLTGKFGTSQCLKNPPLLNYGKASCNSVSADGKTTYVFACDLCFANTSMCFHWMVWVSVVVALMLFLCCVFTCMCWSYCCKRRE